MLIFSKSLWHPLKNKNKKIIMKCKIKDIIIKIDNIVYKDDNPFIFNYYSKILNIYSY